MAADPKAWLALTTEQALDPDLPICDPHHLWGYPRNRWAHNDHVWVRLA